MYTQDKNGKEQFINSIREAYKKNCLFYTMFDECIIIENKRLVEWKKEKEFRKKQNKKQNR